MIEASAAKTIVKLMKEYDDDVRIKKIFQEILQRIVEGKTELNTYENVKDESDAKFVCETLRALGYTVVCRYEDCIRFANYLISWDDENKI
jgi:hypothetical protein